MKNLLTWLITGIASIAFLLIALGYSQDAQARRAYAAAAMIRQQSQARLDLATALMPYFALTTVVVVVAAVAGLVIYALSRTQTSQPAMRIIETRTIILLQPGQSRRQVWQQLSQTARQTAPKRIGGGYEIL